MARRLRPAGYQCTSSNSRLWSSPCFDAGPGLVDLLGGQDALASLVPAFRFGDGNALGLALSENSAFELGERKQSTDLAQPPAEGGIGGSSALT